jgi:hypothetical protein
MSITKLLAAYSDITVGELLVAGLVPKEGRNFPDWRLSLGQLVTPREFKGQMSVGLPTNVRRWLCPNSSQENVARLQCALDYVLLLRKYNPNWSKYSELLELLGSEEVYMPRFAGMAFPEFMGIWSAVNPGSKFHTMWKGQKHIFSRQVPGNAVEAVIAGEAVVHGMLELYELLALPEDATASMIDLLAKVSLHKKSGQQFSLSWEEEIEFQEDGNIVFPTRNRLGRTCYTLDVNGAKFFYPNPSHLWAWMCIGWTIRALEQQEWSFLINRDATPLLAPNRVYGDPSPLNRQLDHNNVGHLSWDTSGEFAPGHTTLGTLWDDKDIYAVSKALPFVWQQMKSVIIQHQANNLRVGSAASAMGKSTVLWQGKNGKLYRVSISDFQVDKLKKLYNRDSLRTRCSPMVGVILREETDGTEFASLLAKY